MRNTAPKKTSNYFTSETEKYIIEYNSTDDTDLRSKIFTKHIYYPFYKLAENIIHSFKFYYTDVDKIEDLKYEIVSMLLEEKIHKYNSEYGAAYSYFGTIVKRWLIAYNNKNFKKVKQAANLEEYEGTYEIDEDVETGYTITLSKFLDMYVEDMYSRLDILFPKDSERKIADAVLTIFKVRKNLEIFKKKALYIYIREITDCETSALTRVLSKLKSEFYSKYMEYEDQGIISRN